MTASPRELDAMRSAIALSALGLGTTSPNPPVGCVILDTAGTQVGTGYHQRKGEPHAEAHALARAGDRARGGTAVVTLEPCNHVGVTPACRQALLDAGIARVVIAVMDPTSRGEGGAAVLRQAGVQVETDVLTEEALLVLEPWLTATRRKAPYVTWAHAVAADTGAPMPFDTGQLRRAADRVLHNGHAFEGVPGGHGAGMIELPSSPVDLTDPGATLLGLFRNGIRTLLLTGTGTASRRLLAADMVDEVVVDMIDPRAPVGVTDGWSTVPEGFRLHSISAVPSGRRMVARRIGRG